MGNVNLRINFGLRTNPRSEENLDLKGKLGAKLDRRRLQSPLQDWPSGRRACPGWQSQMVVSTPIK